MCQIKVNTKKRKKKQSNVRLSKKIKIEEKKPKASFIQSARSGDFDAIKQYVESGEVDINESVVGCTALHYACFYNHLEIVNYLVEKGAEIDAKNASEVTPFNWAVDCGHTEVVKYLIDKCDPGIPDKFGYTPLHRAVLNKNIDLVRLLLSVNTGDEVWVPLNEKTVDEQFTPLHLSVLNRQVDILELLVQSGADINCLSSSQCTPLYYAVFRNYVDVVEKLIELGANVNTIDKLHRTPLHWACLAGFSEIVSILINLSDQNIKDLNNELAFDIAKKTHIQITDLFAQTSN